MVKRILNKEEKRHHRYSFSVLGVDVGGTKISFGVITFNKNRMPYPEVLSYSKIKTPAPRKIITKTVIDIVKTYKKKYKLKGVGISFASRVGLQGNIWDDYALREKGWRGARFKSHIIKKINLPVILKNDGQCFTWGEYNLGQAKKFCNVAGLVLGSGVGGGIILNKVMYNGARNIAGDFGYGTKTTMLLGNELVKISPKGESMIKLYQMITGKEKNTFEIEELAKSGDKNALTVIDYLAISLADILSSVIHSLDPEAIILGGGISRVKMLIQKSLKILKDELPHFLENTKIITSTLNDKANIAGAALFFKDNYL